MNVYVQSVPERAGLLARVASEVEGWGAVCPFVDHDHCGVLWNARRIWRDLAAVGEVAMTMPDDALPHPALAGHLEDLRRPVECGRVEVVSLHTYRNWPPHSDAALAGGHNFASHRDYPNLVGVIMTPHFAALLAEEADRHLEAAERGGPAPPVDDAVAGTVVRRDGIEVWNALPAMVQHDREAPSTIGHGAVSTDLWLRDLPPGWFAEPRLAEARP